MNNYVRPVELKDTLICKNVELISISPYCMQLIYTGDISNLHSGKTREALISLVNNTSYDEAIKKLARNLIINTFIPNKLGETLLQSRETIEFVTNAETANKLYNLLNDINFYSLKTAVNSGTDKMRKELSLRYKTINANTFTVKELREIYREAVRRYNGVKIDFYTVNEGRAYNREKQFGNNKNKIADFLNALYCASTGREIPKNALYVNIEDDIKFDSQSIKIVEYRLRLIKDIPCEIITSDMRNNIAEIERIFRFR